VSNYPYGDSVREFKTGDRVAVHPASSHFLSGYRYGEVVRVGNRVLTVELSRLGHVITTTMNPRNLKVVTD
jgi:hypothetical protein